MTEKFSPAVSVIVPMYNAEKYLSVCLESILNQTFTDFELLVVDDCSTDSSYVIAENYLERFGGRLKIISLPENTGSGSVPRNVGLDLSRGKYVYFVDQDDLIVDDALETLYDFAEKYRAEVIVMEKFFVCDEEIVPKALDTVDWHAELSDNVPAFESDNLGVRVEKFLQQRFACSPWAKFFRRDFLIDNAITLPPMKVADDIIWTFKIICLAEKILRIPERLYVHRNNSRSVSNSAKSPQQTVKLWISPLITISERLEQFMNTLDFFKENPNARLRMQIYFVKLSFIDIRDALKSLKPAEVYEIIFREFSEAGSSQAALIACLIVMTNIYKRTLEERTAHD
ncbi:MAG: glycosyltransferase [Selenomonadaceae bacterium]|nr:glycosyltransferase [Selenomonadaceae bacterium]